MRVSLISLGVCATSLVVMQSENSLQVRCRQCARLIMIVLLVVGLVSCNIMEMSPVRSSHNDSIASCRTSFLQYNGDVASALVS